MPATTFSLLSTPALFARSKGDHTMNRLRSYEHTIVQTVDGPRLIDHARGRPVAAGPEEHVRQDVLLSLEREYGYPLASLLAEERIARGTGNRRRADVLVELPAASVIGHRLEVLPSASHVDGIADRISELGSLLDSPALRIVACPWAVTLRVDGGDITWRCLGFVDCRGGIALAMADDTAPGRGLPPVVNLRVLGYRPTPLDRGVAERLELPHHEFDSAANKRFSETATQALAPRFCRSFNAGVNYDQGIGGGQSHDGRRGFLVLFADPRDAYGALVEIDTDHPAWPALSARLCSMEQGIDSESHLHDTVWRRAVKLDVPTRTLMVVECKAPDIGDSVQILDQGLDYARTRHAQYLVVTGGTSCTWTRSYWLGDGEPRAIEDIPDYASVIGGSTHRVRAVPDAPPHLNLPDDAETRPDALLLHASTRDCVGADLASSHWSAVLRIDDALSDPSFDFAPQLTDLGFSLIEDRGLRWHETTHAAGRIPARYRDLVLSTPDGDVVLFGATVRALRVVRNHDIWGNKHSRSALMGATAHSAGIRNEIEYDLGRGTFAAGRRLLHFEHDGKMAVGRGGSVSNRQVVEYVRERQPALVQGGRVVLGEIDASARPSADSLRRFLARFCAYTMIRRRMKIERASAADE
jgi:hypothetical protein